MVGNDGYIALTDFGLSKKLTGRKRTNSFCGTPNHFSPEIVNRKEYSFEVDIWSFGIFLYELLVGRCPFIGHSAKELFNNISKCEIENNINFPPCVSESAKDLINKILTKEEFRLNIQQIKNHDFYKDINWDKILEKKEKAPFIPKVSSNDDTKYFYIYEDDCKKKNTISDSTFLFEDSGDIIGCFSFGNSCSADFS